MTTRKVIFTNQFQLVVEADVENYLLSLKDKLETINLNSFKKALGFEVKVKYKDTFRRGSLILN